MQKCKIKSIKPIGKEMAYNLTMKSSQHNYAVTSCIGSIYTANSHSAAYAFIAYQTAYLKVNYPIEFMCALLTSELGNEDKHGIYLQEARRMGIEIRSPNINKSGNTYKIEKGVLKGGREGFYLRTPLTAINGIGDKAVESVIIAQPFHTMKDFTAKVDARRVNKKVFASLVMAGCMDDIWGMARPQMIESYEEIKKQASKEKTKEKAAQKRQEKIDAAFGDSGSLFDKFNGSFIKL